jgi:23S rRNA (uridine2552-2'-O)-methyltransferase
MRRWNDDPFTKRAKKENYEARSVYKLSEIEKRERIFQGVRTVIDLGAAPGSWTQFCLERVPQGKIIAIDLEPLRVSHPNLHAIQASIDDVDLAPLMEGGKADLVLSDMAPKTSGIHDRDVLLSFELATTALNVAQKFLKPGGTFVVKLFMGESFEEYQKNVKALFGQVRLLRPESTRKHSREIFFVGKGFKGA